MTDDDENNNCWICRETMDGMKVVVQPDGERVHLRCDFDRVVATYKDHEVRDGLADRIGEEDGP